MLIFMSILCLSVLQVETFVLVFPQLKVYFSVLRVHIGQCDSCKGARQKLLGGKSPKIFLKNGSKRAKIRGFGQK